MVNRRRGRDWVYHQTGTLIQQGLGVASIGIVDILNTNDIGVMTTALHLRTILQMRYATEALWVPAPVMWHVCVLTQSDFPQGIIPVGDARYQQYFPGPGAWEAYDPLRIETNIMMASNTFYGEPSDNVWALRADIKVKRSLNKGDRLCLVFGTDELPIAGGAVELTMDSLTLVRAA